MTTPQNVPASTTTPSAATNVGIYTRGSDPGSIARQLDDCQRAAESRGWRVACHYTDGKAGTYRAGRSGFEQLLVDLADGSIDGIVVYDLDRLTRQSRDVERLLNIYDAAPRLVFVTVIGAVDLSTADGRFMLRMLHNVANYTAADTARRKYRATLRAASQA